MVRVRTLLLAAALGVALGFTASAREAPGFATLSFTSTGAQAAVANLELQAIVAAGRLHPTKLQEDTVLPGRTHERLTQRHEGLPVFGSGIVRQIGGGAVRTVFGRTFDAIAVATSPVLTASAIRHTRGGCRQSEPLPKDRRTSASGGIRWVF